MQVQRRRRRPYMEQGPVLMSWTRMCGRWVHKRGTRGCPCDSSPLLLSAQISLIADDLPSHLTQNQDEMQGARLNIRDCRDWQQKSDGPAKKCRTEAYWLDQGGGGRASTVACSRRGLDSTSWIGWMRLTVLTPHLMSIVHKTRLQRQLYT